MSPLLMFVCFGALRNARPWPGGNPKIGDSRRRRGPAQILCEIDGYVSIKTAHTDG
jgi:hypothetical protein